MSICVAMVDAHKVEQGPMVCSVNGCFNPNSVCLGSWHFSCWITRVSIFQWPQGVSSVNACLTQSLFVWEVTFYLLGS